MIYISHTCMHEGVFKKPAVNWLFDVAMLICGAFCSSVCSWSPSNISRDAVLAQVRGSLSCLVVFLTLPNMSCTLYHDGLY